jgi:hypothetical protein
MKKILKWLWFVLMYRKVAAVLYLNITLGYLEITVWNMEWWVTSVPIAMLFTWTDRPKLMKLLYNKKCNQSS